MTVVQLDALSIFSFSRSNLSYITSLLRRGVVVGYVMAMVVIGWLMYVCLSVSPKKDLFVSFLPKESSFIIRSL